MGESSGTHVYRHRHIHMQTQRSIHMQACKHVCMGRQSFKSIRSIPLKRSGIVHVLQKVLDAELCRCLDDFDVHVCLLEQRWEICVKERPECITNSLRNLNTREQGQGVFFWGGAK